MRNNYAALQRTFAAQGFDVHLAFQNHGGKGTTFPQSLFPWSSPPDTDVVPQLANASCSHVLITGTISFVVDNSETLFDEAIDEAMKMTRRGEVWETATMDLQVWPTRWFLPVGCGLMLFWLALHAIDSICMGLTGKHALKEHEHAGPASDPDHITLAD